MGRLKLYVIESDYYNYIKEFDDKIIYSDNDKNKRPFIGIVLQFEEEMFFAPLASPKPKHLKMKNSLDFLKINGGELGVINFNNMIPIPPGSAQEIDINKLPTKSKGDRDYKNLLIKQISWCNQSENREKIKKKAFNLIDLMIAGKLKKNIVNRCCNFPLLIKKAKDYKNKE